MAIAVGAALAFVLVDRSRPNAPPPIGGPAPGFDLPAIGFDGRVRLADMKGHPIVLGVLDTRWDSWLDGVEGLERINRALRRRNLAVVGVFLDPDVTAAREFVGTHPVTFTPAHDPGGVALRPAFGHPVAPELMLIDASGNVVARSGDVKAWLRPPFRKLIEPYVEPLPPGY